MPRSELRTMTEAPHQTIARMVHEREGRSDAEILSELRALEPLPPEGAEDWALDATWNRACLLVALGDVVAVRRLREGVAEILNCMCLGDPGESMRGMRHSIEAAVDHDWAFLARACVDGSRSDRAGTRFWATDELGILRDVATLDTMIALLDDPEPEVSRQACSSLVMLVQHHPELIQRVAGELHALSERRADVREDALRRLADIAAMGEEG